MNITKNAGFCCAMVLGLATTLLAGCASHGPQAYNLNIAKAGIGSIRVDLVGVKESDEPIWIGYGVDKYWSEGDQRRLDAAPLSMILEKGKPWIISKTDPKWKEWQDRGDTELLIIADLPGNFPAGPADPRLRFEPLTGWQAKDDTLEFEIQNTMITPLTPRKSN